jgi:hypothetical protein
LTPGSPEVHRDLGEFLARIGQLDEAEIDSPARKGGITWTVNAFPSPDPCVSLTSPIGRVKTT